MARQGKIARLPAQIREQLNQMLLDGEPARLILSWLNESPEVKKILKRQFSARPVNDSNLTNWRIGGFKDWQAGQFQSATFRELNARIAALERWRGSLASPSRLHRVARA